MIKKLGQQSIMFAKPPIVAGSGSIVGPMEGDGLLGAYYDEILPDNLNNQTSWEKSESMMLEWSIRKAIEKARMQPEAIDCILAGDLLNQLMSCHFAIRSLERPFLGLYGACSTMVESLLIGSMLIDGGFYTQIVAAVSSHHDAAERQYRFPTELGVQRPMVAQWTVTGSGAVVVATHGHGPQITCGTVGKIVDMGIKDPNAMGPAMAPAAVDTIRRHTFDTGRPLDYYDRIFTGDLGSVGKTLVIDLLREEGLDIASFYEDCGTMIYRDDQDTHAGASGCACSAIVLAGYLYQQMMSKHWTKVLLVGTGSLHSTTSYQQKESIPGIAHAIALEI